MVGMLYAAGAFYLLWALYIVAMALQRARRAGVLTTTALVPCSTLGGKSVIVKS